MNEHGYEGSADELRVVEGRSEVGFDDALEAAVAKAVELGISKVGDEMVVLEQRVRIDNPKIGEYRIVVGPRP
jgi:hypothetical protein